MLIPKRFIKFPNSGKWNLNGRQVFCKFNEPVNVPSSKPARPVTKVILPSHSSTSLSSMLRYSLCRILPTKLGHYHSARA